ncbi:MAG: 6-bladed beta-propeller [Gemmatimonadales bacterium]
MRSTTFATVAALCAWWALALPAGPLAAQISGLTEVQRYGWEEAAPRAAALAQTRLGGGILSNVADLAEGPDGALYVLDRGESKVVVFEPNGAVRRVVGNGKGEGPGEFSRPTSIAVAPSGDLMVLDGNRVHVFDSTGQYRRVFKVTAAIPHQIRVAGGRIVVSQYVLRAGTPSIQTFDLDGTPSSTVFAPSAEDIAFSRTGASYRLADGPRGVAVAHPNPGRWTNLSGGKPLGRYVEGDNAIVPPSPSQPASSRVTLRGFGMLPSGNGLVLYDRELAKPTRGSTESRRELVLAEIAPTGRIVRRIIMPDVGRQLLVSRDGTSFYLTVDEPTYQVVRFRLAR